MNVPEDEVVAAAEGNAIEVIRRVEFYEYDGETRWNPVPNEEDYSRLIGGSIGLDTNREERRVLSGLELENLDDRLRPTPDDGLWYDKVIKVFRGYRYETPKKPPRVLIVEAENADLAYSFRSTLSRLGWFDTHVDLDAATEADLAGYDVAVSYMREGKTAKPELLEGLWLGGKSVITVGSNNDETTLPFITGSTKGVTQNWILRNMANDTPLAGGWSDETQNPSSSSVTRIYDGNFDPSTIPVARRFLEPEFYFAFIAESQAGGRWFHYHPPTFGPEALKLLRNALNWIANHDPYKVWEIQLGEFVIDKINEKNFPHTLTIEGRDYTKRCLHSKVEKSVTFVAGTAIRDLVIALAANSGCYKHRLPNNMGKLSSDLTIERGTPRWDIIKQACESNGYDVFFDNEGFITAKQIADPSLDPVFMTYKTGPEGNLVSYDKSTNDSRVYNKVVVTGENESQDGGEIALPFYGEASNTDPSSPTRIARIGERTYFFTSTFFTSDQQCIDLAVQWLKVHALESYEVNWDSICFPWQDVGVVVEFIPERRYDNDPTKFLLDTLTIPLSLGSMSATAKRVVFVSPDTEGEVPTDDEASQ